ncbi:AFR252Cp [Eremothecium gossypii ATCC 10895]|uniref:AFR252Cp n=1 Tax=Eremothecium gossypii (strain ATCC 10895 / CBS 109.51 / FGSC 9923 / NRRL Y-1056) TaxID=284811 RepID=Q753S4_EREGS|nr:AFR252Cp [Eremothecium gossypii ATCC 10895]AAS53623.1 AFR252Cp [Eremothecium gossypii ATCC 10895]AEY97936.1 FAFR252Cp [Eremothecium gossypii FDAG1]
MRGLSTGRSVWLLSLFSWMLLRTLPRVSASRIGLNRAINFRTMTTMKSETDFAPLFEKIDELKPRYLERLSKAIGIPAVSGDESMRAHVVRKADFLAAELERLGFTDVEKRELGPQPAPVQTPGLKLPPVLLARYGQDAAKKTVLVYAHYDVQPANKDDGWATEPFEFYLDEKNGVMRGRGVTDDTGPLTGWLNVVEAFQEAGIELPVNLVVCFEGMEESGSIGLEELIEQEKDKYFAGVDAVCISDNYWLGTKKPVLTYGLRGVNYYQVAIEGPAADLHSGLFGGAVAEPMTDLVKVLNTLVDSQGRILIEGVDEMVAPVTDAERALYDKIDYSLEEFNQAVGANISLYEDKRDILMHRWRYPSLSLHGVEGAFYGAGEKTVIPAKVIGKFSIRTVPDMDSDKLNKLVMDHCRKAFEKLGSPNKCTPEVLHCGAYWLSNPFNASFSAASKAIKAVYNVEPDFTREGGSIPITLFFEEKLKTDVLLLPMGRGDDGAHSINEKLDLSNYFGGMKTMAAYLYYYSISDSK